ncbi:LOW QUALITY PROTEIN: hypothetical protein Cgig2_023663 [Carnegiea gigantea]|uniref:Uncharacterized protein n=1 Tax=Carnegiea gigantea TaxID=171969 RepID=A0A9Q1QLN0_9CARY|nr:LOW QUALITY PROTEIN: hypothetical protein Cgig2_023663 [Carnegiea gigantea]
MTLIFRSHDISIQEVSCLIRCVINLTKRRNKLHLLGVSALVLSPLALVGVVEPWSLAWAALSAPVVASALAFESASSNWCCRSFSSASQASCLAFNFSQCCWYRVTRPSSLRYSVTALTLRANASAIVTFSSVILGDPSRGVGLDEVGRQPLGTHERAADGLRNSPHGLRGSECRGVDWSPLASPAEVRVDAAVSSGQPLVRWRLRTGRLIVGFFPRVTRGGGFSRNNSSVYPKQKVTMKGANKSIPSRLADSQGAVSPLPDDAQPWLPPTQEWRPKSQRLSTSPSLALHKTKEKSGHNQTKKMANTRAANTLGKILKDQEAHRGKEEVVPEKL